MPVSSDLLVQLRTSALVTDDMHSLGLYAFCGVTTRDIRLPRHTAVGLPCISLLDGCFEKVAPLFGALTAA